MRAADGPLAMFLEGARRLARAPLPFAALWLSALIATYASGRILSGENIEVWTKDGGFNAFGAVVSAPWLLVSSFLSGGVLSRYARPTAGTGAFFAGCRAYFGRMLRLTLISLLGYELLYIYLQPALATIHVTAAEVTIFAGVLFLQACIQLGTVRTIVEDRRSVLFALAAGWRLLLARPGTLLVLYGLTTVALIVWLLPTVVVLVSAVTVFERPLPAWQWNALVMTAIVWFDLQVSASLVVLYEAEMVRRNLAPAPALSSSGLSGLNALTVKE